LTKLYEVKIPKLTLCEDSRCNLEATSRSITK
jgi:hypothetical protein